MIAPGVVLTAAHCTVDDGSTFVGDTVIVGGTQSGETTNAGTAVTVAAQAPHPLYDIESSYMDIMLLKLEDAVQAQGSVSLVLNTDSSTPVDGQTLTVIGLGDTFEGSQAGSDDLLQVDIPTVSTDRCNEGYEGEVVDEVMICAGGIEGEDSCQGKFVKTTTLLLQRRCTESKRYMFILSLLGVPFLFFIQVTLEVLL